MQMKPGLIVYKFINNYTQNVIAFFSIEETHKSLRGKLEDRRQQLAIDNGINLSGIYYLQAAEDEL